MTADQCGQEVTQEEAQEVVGMLLPVDQVLVGEAKVTGL